MKESVKAVLTNHIRLEHQLNLTSASSTSSKTSQSLCTSSFKRKNKQNHSPYTARKEKAGISLKRTHSTSKRDFKPEKIYEVEEANDRFADIFRNHGFSCSHEERSQLAHFYSLMMKNQTQVIRIRMMSQVQLQRNQMTIILRKAKLNK